MRIEEGRVFGCIKKIIAIPGVGRKTAERVVLELRSKVDKIKESEGQTVSYGIKQEAISALTTLGYNYKIAESVLRDILTSSKDISLEELIKKALGNLNK